MVFRPGELVGRGELWLGVVHLEHEIEQSYAAVAVIDIDGNHPCACMCIVGLASSVPFIVSVRWSHEEKATSV